ncbi:MAG: hypothetical protein KAI74_01350 [Kiritimatiellae bacterium]|nr:hypothetical protein [Kiritimatiellia bacterium]
MKNIKILFSLLGMICLLTPVVSADGNEKIRSTIEQLNRAAMNREWAGAAMLEQAVKQQAEAVALTQESFETADERRSALRSAGKKYITASRLCASAISNFDKASGNYDKIVRLCAKIGDLDDKVAFQAESVKTREKGTDACKQAAVLCEAAAGIYNGDADHLQGAASATQSAAGWWEKLATR